METAIGRKVRAAAPGPVEELDRRIAGQATRPAPRRTPVMATATPDPAATSVRPYVPPISAEELARRNGGLIELLDSWEAEGDEQEQRETLVVLREALGEGRVSSSRNLFP
jgi:hypothetical protein